MPAPDFALAREHMVRHQLAARGIHDQRVLSAMRAVPRELFVSGNLQSLAYNDQALGIDCDQTISQPFIVGLMSQALEIKGSERVLEIGTGCGYQTAVLATMGAEVYTIERHAPLLEHARQRLAELNLTNVHYRVGDGRLGWPEHAPYDRIIITAATEECPAPLWHQLSDENGILVAPFGSDYSQYLQARHKLGDRTQTRTLCGCRFVPLLPGVPDE